MWSSEMMPTASARGQRGMPGAAPTWAERQTEKGHRGRLLHGTGALLPASAGAGQLLLHGVSKAGWRA